jgi:hypothetical protein
MEIKIILQNGRLISDRSDSLLRIDNEFLKDRNQ